MQNIEISFSFAAVTFGYVAYFFIAHAEKRQAKFFEQPTEKAWVTWVIFQRVVGMVFLGVLPLVLAWIIVGKTPLNYGLGIQNAFYTLTWVGSLGIVIVSINFFNARKPDSLAMYPQIRTKNWTARIFWLNALSWAGYLLAYEFLFRGILLFGTLSLGFIPALAINASIYSLAHIPKGIKETIGAVPLGLLLSYLTLESETIWIAFLVHLTLALSNDIFSLYFHPEIHYKKIYEEKAHDLYTKNKPHKF